MLTQWGAENDENFKSFYEEEMQRRTKGNDNADLKPDANCKS